MRPLSSLWLYIPPIIAALLTAQLTLASQTPSEVRVNFVSLSGFTTKERAKLDAAADVLERVLASREFHQAVLDFTWSGKLQFADNDGLTNEEIYQTLMAGKELLNGREDQTMDLELTIYNPGLFGRSTVGYTYADSPLIHLNRRFFSGFTPVQVAANLVHEWCHQLGFAHDFNRTAKRPYSVPYGIGSLMEDLGAKLTQ